MYLRSKLLIMGKKSFANRLSGRVIGIVSAIFLVAMLVVAIVSHKMIVDEATRGTQYILHGAISEIEKPLTEVEISTQTVAAYSESMRDHPEIYQTIVHRTVEISELINGCAILFLDKDGRCDLSSPSVFSYMDANGVHDFHPDAQQLQQLAELWAKQPFETKNSFWTPPYHALDSRNTDISSYCYPLMDAGLNVYAIVVSDLSVDWIETMMEDIRPYPNSLTALVCDENNIIGLKDSTLVNRYKSSFKGDQEFLAVWEDMKLNKDSIRRKIGNDRNMSFVVYGGLHNGWKLSILCPYHDVLHRPFLLTMYMLLISLAVLAILFFVCRRLIRNLTRPISELSESAINMAKGDFKTELPEIKTEDEMKQLRDSFQFMQDSITNYIGELKTTTAANERMESELNVARKIQMGMLRTDFPPQLYALLKPAKEVGGDLYDFNIKDDHLFFGVGDVSGKGVPASLMMAITRALLHFVEGMRLPLDEAMVRLNNSVSKANSRGMFVTLFIARIDLKTHRMDYCNAGHNPVIIIPPCEDPFFLKAKTNLAIGLVEGFPFEIESLELKPGTRIVAYTDGVNEAEKEDYSIFGNNRLLEWARELHLECDDENEEKQVVESLYQSVQDFVAGNDQNDDITIVSLKI